ncbi:MAG: V/A-type H+/Na+-transporting ATPase subunit [Bacteroidota bacterium]|jgi:V/A-type H+-transporting ATPase subunit D|nr:V-type ATPase, subunit [Methermicoccus sp.]MBZ4674933.1 V-type ATPase, subunit [Dysgonamonadaceae bacterium]MDI3505928.1 V/A-type H+/Na+-transporting ATPase subunit [Bacteroidota bacterium]MDK2836938.1 V/A-type H+/Na+-transporting ATPase subunit [Bacteroidota bacterium]MDK2969880.1 V/A-type H+/Na+-transporting ATPase subunit [Bacteroidota bacterium]
MAIKFQYNKTSRQQLEKQLNIRVRALPTLQSKETALRMEVKKAKNEMKLLEKELEEKIHSYDKMVGLWTEFDASLVSIKDVHLSRQKIAGVPVPSLDKVDFEVKPFSLFNQPKWFLDGVQTLETLAEIGIKRDFYELKLTRLEFARKKTTQKVNLFEKVQIPGYQDAILKIKRYLEDEENLSKSSQKIMRAHQEQRKQEGNSLW